MVDHDELDLAEAPPAGGRPRRWGWVAQPLIQRVAVGLAVLLVSGALSIALMDTPSADRVSTEAADDRDGARRSEGRRGPAGGGSGTTVDGAGDDDASGSSGRGSRRSGGREGRGGGRGDKDRERDRDAGRSSGGGESPTTTTTTGPPTSAPGSLLVEPAGALTAFAPVGVAPDRPCPPGTAIAEVRITATGGPLDGEVLIVEAVTPGSDGSWSAAGLVVPAVAGVDGVGWAATAPSVTVDATCDGGSAYAPSTVALAAVGEIPAFEVTWDGTTASATATACPTHVRLEVFVGPTAPVLDGDVEATAAEAMVPEVGDPTTWTGTITPTYDEGTDGLWASASCLSQADGRPVWRHTLVQLESP